MFASVGHCYVESIATCGTNQGTDDPVISPKLSQDRERARTQGDVPFSAARKESIDTNLQPLPGCQSGRREVAEQLVTQLSQETTRHARTLGYCHPDITDPKLLG